MKTRPISLNVDEREWERLARELPTLDRGWEVGPDPIASPAPIASPDPVALIEAWALGPEGQVQFSSGNASYVYDGSVSYLAAGLRDWLERQPTSSTLDSESVYQAPTLTLEVDGSDVVASFEDHRGLHVVRIPRDAFRDAARQLVSEVSARLRQITESSR